MIDDDESSVRAFAAVQILVTGCRDRSVLGCKDRSSIDSAKATTLCHGIIIILCKGSQSELRSLQPRTERSRQPGDQDLYCRKGAYGRFIVINHVIGLTTLYGHLSRIVVQKRRFR